MVLHSILLGGLLLGADVGWRPLPDSSGVEYLIQLSPKDLELMQRGEAWMTDIPPSVGDVRAYRITVGAETLDRVDFPPKPPSLGESPAAVDATPNRMNPEATARPLPERQAVYMTPEQGEGEASATADLSTPPLTTSKASETSPRPWMLLIGTALALAGSLGGNAYLLWGLLDAHRRYRELATGLTETTEA